MRKPTRLMSEMEVMSLEGHKPRQRTYPHLLMQEAWNLHGRGETTTQISRKLGINRSTLKKYFIAMRRWLGQKKDMKMARRSTVSDETCRQVIRYVEAQEATRSQRIKHLQFLDICVRRFRLTPKQAAAVYDRRRRGMVEMI